MNEVMFEMRSPEYYELWTNMNVLLWRHCGASHPSTGLGWISKSEFGKWTMVSDARYGS